MKQNTDHQPKKSNAKTKAGIVVAIIILVMSLIFTFYTITITAEKNRFLGNWYVDTSSCDLPSGYNYAILTYLYFANDGTCISEGSSWERGWLGWNEKTYDPMHGEWKFDWFAHKLTLSTYGIKIICDYEFDGDNILYLSNFHGQFSYGTRALNAYYIKTNWFD